MNRDYFARPIQAHSRTAPDYGNTRLHPANDNPHRGTIRLFLASAGLIIAVVLAAIAGGA